MTRVDGAERSGNDYVLDPGHPDAVEYTVEQYLNVVREYDVDGIHLDLVRYMGVDWGYNPTSLERYRAETGAVGTPDPQDEQWKQWRREQVTNLMRQVYLRSIAIRPDIKVSVAVIAWGEGPTSEEEYRRSAPMQQVMQDWNAWLSEGIIDMVIPMNYDREHDPNQKLWYDQWIAWEKDHQYERQIAIGPGAYLNSVWAPCPRSGGPRRLPRMEIGRRGSAFTVMRRRIRTEFPMTNFMPPSPGPIPMAIRYSPSGWMSPTCPGKVIPKGAS